MPTNWLRSSFEGYRERQSRKASSTRAFQGHPLFELHHQLRDSAGVGFELLVEGVAVGDVEDLDHARFVGPFAFADDVPGVATEGLQEIVVHGRIVQLRGTCPFGIEFGLLEVGPGVGDLVELGRDAVTWTIASCRTSAIRAGEGRWRE